MKVRVIKSYTDKYSMTSVEAGKELEISKGRFLELTEGPRGIFVEEIIEKKPVEKKVATKATKK